MINLAGVQVTKATCRGKRRTNQDQRGHDPCYIFQLVRGFMPKKKKLYHDSITTILNKTSH
jgi:hypothetical protein